MKEEREGVTGLFTLGRGQGIDVKLHPEVLQTRRPIMAYVLGRGDRRPDQVGEWSVLDGLHGVHADAEQAREDYLRPDLGHEIGLELEGKRHQIGFRAPSFFAAF